MLAIYKLFLLRIKKDIVLQGIRDGLEMEIEILCVYGLEIHKVKRLIVL